ncbi:hypothetical protein [Streptomyces sp. AC1-42T]|uniref:hypothetical protein n=1 Tax=Streptomyces sp. AC1-42T TaxID=2218665 RepID=UPI000DABF9F2|nr:hypothetical protein [Streptomyces sp. AC1-42T]PZT71405.1 hypothetical protein DNK55_32345 [Streptomyces sp. AC1-42T]
MTTRNGCPKPDVSAYATQQAAASAAKRVQIPVGKLLTPYLCECDWWHLTGVPRVVLRPAGLTPRPGDGLLLKDMPYDLLVEVARRDVRGTGSREEALALRHPSNLTPWRRALKDLWRDVQQQFDARADDTSEDARLWRARAQVYRSVIAERRNEAQLRVSRAASLAPEQRYRWQCAEAAAVQGQAIENLAEVVELVTPLTVAA